MHNKETPEQVDLVIAGGELTTADRALLSAFIKKQRAAAGRVPTKRAMAKGKETKRPSRRRFTKTKVN